MTKSARIAAFRTRLASFEVDPLPLPRRLAHYAAALTLADIALMSELLAAGKKCGVGRQPYYEIVLQSYLFLGFPRMLIAAETLATVFELDSTLADTGPVTAAESAQWYASGVDLCRRIYGDNYEPLRTKVESIAPEIFRWMVIEGYGKVLSRPGLGQVEREVAVVAMLTMENREQQLHSHMRGALNVGAPPELLRMVIEDLGEVAEGHDTAVQLLKRLKVA